MQQAASCMSSSGATTLLTVFTETSLSYLADLLKTHQTTRCCRVRCQVRLLSLSSAEWIVWRRRGTCKTMILFFHVHVGCQLGTWTLPLLQALWYFVCCCQFHNFVQSGFCWVGAQQASVFKVHGRTGSLSYMYHAFFIQFILQRTDLTNEPDSGLYNSE